MAPMDAYRRQQVAASPVLRPPPSAAAAFKSSVFSYISEMLVFFLPPRFAPFLTLSGGSSLSTSTFFLLVFLQPAAVILLFSGSLQTSRKHRAFKRLLLVSSSQPSPNRDRASRRHANERLPLKSEDETVPGRWWSASHLFTCSSSLASFSHLCSFRTNLSDPTSPLPPLGCASHMTESLNTLKSPFNEPTDERRRRFDLRRLGRDDAPSTLAVLR